MPVAAALAVVAAVAQATLCCCGVQPVLPLPRPAAAGSVQAGCAALAASVGDPAAMACGDAPILGCVVPPGAGWWAAASRRVSLSAERRDRARAVCLQRASECWCGWGPGPLRRGRPASPRLRGSAVAPGQVRLASAPLPGRCDGRLCSPLRRRPQGLVPEEGAPVQMELVQMDGAGADGAGHGDAGTGGLAESGGRSVATRWPGPAIGSPSKKRLPREPLRCNGWLDPWQRTRSCRVGAACIGPRGHRQQAGAGRSCRACRWRLIQTAAALISPGRDP